MQRGNDTTPGELGPQLVGEKITINRRVTSVIRQLGEGGFSYVFLVKDISEDENHTNGSNSNTDSLMTHSVEHFVLKITSIHSRQQRDIAEKEAKLLSRLSHPSIVRMHDSCYRSIPSPIPNEIQARQSKSHGHSGQYSSKPQHLILLEYCEGGTALDVCNQLKMSHRRFDLQSLIIAFGQICNAVSYLHAQRPPIVHRDLKPVNFLVKNGAYKLCDFGSAVFGHVDLRTTRARTEAEEVIEKTTTQMFRSPEMVDLYMSKKLTQSTDVWALGCCLYSLAFLQNCFEEGSNLAILSCNYKIPDDNPYGDDLAELIDRMLTVDCRERADMTEVILCLSAIYSDRPLPPRKHSSKPGKEVSTRKPKKERVGTYRTDGQGIHGEKQQEKKPVEAKKLNPNSAAARRRKAAQSGGVDGSIPLSRTSSKIRKPKSITATASTTFDETFANSNFAFKSDDIGFDPFHVAGDTFSAFKEDYESSELSNEGMFDFASDNGSGFDTFGSDDGSLSFGKAIGDKNIMQAVSNANKDFGSMDADNLNFDNFHIHEEGDKDISYVEGDPSAGILKKKKKGLKKLFQRKNEN